MNESIIQIISIFSSSFVALAVCLINNRYQQNKTLQEVSEKQNNEFRDFKDTHSSDINDIKMLISEVKAEYRQQISLLTERIDVLSERVEKHNNVMEKVYDLQTLAVKMGEIQKRADERMDYIEKRFDKLEAV